MGAHIRWNPNFESDLRRMVEEKLPDEMDRRLAALARRLKGKDRATIRKVLEQEGFKNIKDGFVDAMHAGEPVPIKIIWR